jgi:hypothetical protein
MNNNPSYNNRGRGPSNPVPINSRGRGGTGGQGGLERNSFSNTNRDSFASSSVSSSYNQSSSLIQRPSLNHRTSFGRTGKSDSLSGPNDRRLPHNGHDNDQEISSGLSKMMSQKKVEVKSGSIGAFNPSMLVSHSQLQENIRLNSHDEVEDGVFVDRSTQDMIIAQVSHKESFFEIINLFIPLIRNWFQLTK